MQNQTSHRDPSMPAARSSQTVLVSAGRNSTQQLVDGHAEPRRWASTSKPLPFRPSFDSAASDISSQSSTRSSTSSLFSSPSEASTRSSVSQSPTMELGGGSVAMDLLLAPHGVNFSQLQVGEDLITIPGRSVTDFNSWTDDGRTYTEPEPNREYSLPCPYLVLRCEETFASNNIELWMDHALSHFEGYSPTCRAICLFCDEEFENRSDANANWEAWMRHIAARHLSRGESIVKPDFITYQRFHEIGVLSDDEYESLKLAGENPYRPATVMPRNFRPQREHQHYRHCEIHDQQKEDRQRRRAAQRRR